MTTKAPLHASLRFLSLLSILFPFLKLSTLVYQLVVVGSEVGRPAELARGPNSYLTLSLPIHTPLLGG